MKHEEKIDPDLDLRVYNLGEVWFLHVLDYIEQFVIKMLYCRIVGFAPVTIKKYTVGCEIHKIFSKYFFGEIAKVF